MRLYNQFVKTEQGNYIFSPLSVSLGLAITSLGARNQTLKEIRRSTFTSKFPENQIHGQFQQILTVLRRFYEKEQVNFANLFYVNESYKILSSFHGSSLRFYYSKPEIVDLSWLYVLIAREIRDISLFNFSNETVAILINVLFFKSQWRVPFNESLTRKLNFYTKNGSAVKTVFLCDINSNVYYGIQETHNFEVLEKDFISQDFRFGIILPNLGKTTFEEVEKSLILKPFKLNLVTANITIPKFKFQSTFEVANNLKKLGIRNLFLRGKADLSGIEKTQNLYVSNIFHKTVIDIGEKGANAAAVTVFLYDESSAYLPPSRVVNFIADHPFLFYIKHVDTGLILLLGRFIKP